MADYGFKKVLDSPFETVKKRVTEELKKEGFGILTEIDASAKFKEKLGIDFKKYVIMGACNPAYAHRAILAEEDIGLFLPCNVLLYEKDHGTALAIVKPTVTMRLIKNDALRDMAADVESKLQRVFDAVAQLP